MTRSPYSWREAALLATAFFLGNTQAYQGWPGSNTLVDGEAVRFSQQTWRQHLRHPDAKGEYPVRGYDISQQWPAVQEVDGWRLAVNVSSRIPASEVQNKNQSGTAAVAVATGLPPSSPTTNSSSFMGTSISLKAPENVIHSILGEEGGEVDEIIALELRSTTWKVCVTIATDNGGNEGAGSGGGSGDCDRLPAQCVADFEQAYAEHFAETEDCAGHPPPTPASCGGALDAASLRTIQYPIDAVNGTELYVTASDAHAAPGNLTAWNDAAASAKLWPVLVVWGWNHRASMNNDINVVGEVEHGEGAAATVMAATKPLAQLSCIKAVGNKRPAPTPTATPTTVPESAGGVAMESATSTLTGLALLTVALSFVLFC
ncbi:hypothetical protein PG985_014151 [Apiospora marii]|uniref:uncharacterized protein n=1 Tax=Apiospora marii TaxID=335849 RepID=UPI00313215BA